MIVHAAYDAPGAYNHRRTRPEDSPTFALFSQAGFIAFWTGQLIFSTPLPMRVLSVASGPTPDNIATAADLPSLAGSGLNKSLASLPVSATWK